MPMGPFWAGGPAALWWVPMMFAAMVVFAVVALRVLRAPSRLTPPAPAAPPAIPVAPVSALAQRYARGEIDDVDFMVGLQQAREAAAAPGPAPLG